MAALACCSLMATAQTVTPEKRVLVFSKTAGFRHSSIPAGKTAILKLGKETGFAVDTTENAAVFTNKNLQKYSAVIFLNTTGNVLNDKQQDAFERYIQAGGGYVNIPPLRGGPGIDILFSPGMPVTWSQIDVGGVDGNAAVDDAPASGVDDDFGL